jgi:hypothetical protein
MLAVLEREHHGTRLRDLLVRFRRQENAVTDLLHDLQGRLQEWHREANHLRSLSRHEAEDALKRCTDLQAKCDQLATELVHVRMAISGTREELADHENRPAPQGGSRRFAAMA